MIFPMPTFLKRFEIWALLLVAAGLLYFVLRPDPGTDDPTLLTAPPDPVEDPGPPFVLDSVKTLPSTGGTIIETVLTGRSPTGEDLSLDEAATTAFTADGKPVRRFFEPFAEPAVLLGSETSRATLRWWLPEPTSALLLEIDGHRIDAEIP